MPRLESVYSIKSLKVRRCKALDGRFGFGVWFWVYGKAAGAADTNVPVSVVNDPVETVND